MIFTRFAWTSQLRILPFVCWEKMKKNLIKKISNVTLMGNSQEISWKQEGGFLIIKKNFKSR